MARESARPVPLAAERLRRLRTALQDRGRIRVSEAASALAVSEETIRRDIRALVAEGVAQAVFGGAVPREGTRGVPPPALPPVDARAEWESAAKDAMAAQAARLIEPGQSVILDAGTSALALARALRDTPDLTVITNALPTAQAVAVAPGAVVYVVGGRYIARSHSLIGPQAQRDFNAVSADWVFLGAQAIDARLGFTSADPDEAEVKRAMIRAARRVAVLADSTKFAARGFVTFAAFSDVDLLLTAPEPPAELRTRLEDAGVAVTVCSLSREERS